MGAVRSSGVFWVAGLKKDPHGQNVKIDTKLFA
jgi:hypothetical protein